MGFFSDDSDQAQAYQQVQSGQHQSSWSHELIGAAAGFAAERAYANHCAANGKPQSHQLAKELMAGFAAAEADKLFETHGLDALDREEAKRHARKQAEEAISQDNYQQNY